MFYTKYSSTRHQKEILPNITCQIFTCVNNNDRYLHSYIDISCIEGMINRFIQYGYHENRGGGGGALHNLNIICPQGDQVNLDV